MAWSLDELVDLLEHRIRKVLYYNLLRIYSHKIRERIIKKRLCNASLFLNRSLGLCSMACSTREIILCVTPFVRGIARILKRGF